MTSKPLVPEACGSALAPGFYEQWQVSVRLERYAVDISALLSLLEDRERVDGGEADLARRMFRQIKQSLRSQCAAPAHHDGYGRVTDLSRRYCETTRAAYGALRAKVHTVPGRRWAQDLAAALAIIDDTIQQLRRDGPS